MRSQFCTSLIIRHRKAGTELSVPTLEPNPPSPTPLAHLRRMLRDSAGPAYPKRNFARAFDKLAALTGAALLGCHLLSECFGRAAQISTASFIDSGYGISAGAGKFGSEGSLALLQRGGAKNLCALQKFDGTSWSSRSRGHDGDERDGFIDTRGAE